MAFDEVRLPLKVGYGSAGGPMFSTEIVENSAGREQRNQNWSQPRRKYDARTGLKNQTDAALLAAFFYGRAGRARGFRLRDWTDYSSTEDGCGVPGHTDQIIGTGDGASTIFQLIKTYGAGDFTYRREIKKPVLNSVLIAIDATMLSAGWSIDHTTGVVTFSDPPVYGAQITAGFYFDVPVRFDCDVLTISKEQDRQTSAEIPLIEVRVP